MTPSCREACKANFTETKALFGPAVCKECQGCIMSQVYKETDGEHPSTMRLLAIEDRSLQYATLATSESGEEEPAA